MLPFTDRPTERALPVFAARVAAGFPSPADDHVDGALDLNDHLVHHPAATFFVRATGESMTGAGIFDGDLLIVDRSLPPDADDVVIAAIHGELTVKRLCKSASGWMLSADNPAFPSLPLDEAGCEIWGVVTHSVRRHGPG